MRDQCNVAVFEPRKSVLTISTISYTDIKSIQIKCSNCTSMPSDSAPTMALSPLSRLNNPLHMLANVSADPGHVLSTKLDRQFSTPSTMLGKKTTVSLLDAISSCQSAFISSSSDMSASSSSEEDDTTMMSPIDYLERLFARHGVRLSGRRSSSHQIKSNRRPCPTEVDAYDMETTRAVRTGDLDKLKELYGKGYSLDASNKHGESLLHISCRRGAASIVKFMLLEAKVNPRVMDDMGRTAFHDVLWSSTPNFDTLDILLQVLPPVSLLIQDVRGHTPFHYAPRKHWGVWVDYLKEREGAFVQWISSRKQLAAAAKLRQSHMLQMNRQFQPKQSSPSSPAVIPASRSA